MRVIVIGGGVSGLTSAIYLSRANINVDVFNKGYYGALSDSPLVENFPGFPEGISGFELLDNMTTQAQNGGAIIHDEEIIKIDIDNNTVLSDSQVIYEYDYLIISTGCKPRKLSAKNIEKFENKGIHYCAVCDGSFYKDKEVIVVGGGNTALTEAIYLSNIAKQVNVFVRRDIIRADKCLFDKLNNLLNVNVLMNVEIKECYGDKQLRQISYLNKSDGVIYNKLTDAIFVSIGSDKNMDLIQNIELSNVDNIFLNGDLVNKYHQAIISAGKGAEIALEIIDKIYKKF